ncbi:MAG: diguanylate cyclase [Gammaproteobacteria bacterium]|nr:diguanylate cyclase [Gammaproteobacteria bacterium]MBU1730748.1 diguanylate cyclase [Gammaproteobacteria bacterium]MBU1891294.1 diguanylate cyclase [Gammaproteobacteria bacterium]
MQIERISLKTLTVSIVIVLGLVSVFLLFVTALFFRDAALKSQNQSLSRVMDVAAQEVVKQLHNQAFTLGSTFQNRTEFRVALEQFRQGNGSAALREVLDDPIAKGFVGAVTLDLVKLRLYDLDLKMIAQSDAGIQGLTPHLTPLLHDQAVGRSSAERLKALGGIWISPAGPLYSVLLPVGGLRLTGYIEVVVNPTFNLAVIAAMTRMPLTIYSASGKMLSQSENGMSGHGGKTLEVEYLLRADNGEDAYRLVGLADVAQLNLDMARSGIIGVLAFIALIGFSVLIGLWVFSYFLFLPLGNMQKEMERSALGDLSVTVGQKNTLKEFHALAAAFNTMARKVERNIHELQRLSSVDGLTGVNNRRQFDLSLQEEWLRAQRDNQELSLLMLDIDYFKQYNDAYGHLGGDDCLRMLSSLLRETVQRPGDVVARYGGEEFAILLPDTSKQGAQFLAFKIAAELAHLGLPHASSPLGGRVTLSIGCATCKANPECQPESLVRAADKALYKAKEMGRDRIVVHDIENIPVKIVEK